MLLGFSVMNYLAIFCFLPAVCHVSFRVYVIVATVLSERGRETKRCLMMHVRDRSSFTVSLISQWPDRAVALDFLRN